MVACLTAGMMIVQSAGKLLELAIMVSIVLPMLACILLSSNISDERLTLKAPIANYMLLSTMFGVTLLCCC